MAEAPSPPLSPSLTSRSPTSPTLHRDSLNPMLASTSASPSEKLSRPSTGSAGETSAFAGTHVDYKETPEAHLFKADLISPSRPILINIEGFEAREETFDDASDSSHASSPASPHHPSSDESSSDVILVDLPPHDPTRGFTIDRLLPSPCWVRRTWRASRTTPGLRCCSKNS